MCLSLQRNREFHSGGGIVFDGEMMQGELMVGFPKAIRPHLKPFFLCFLALAGGFFAPL